MRQNVHRGRYATAVTLSATAVLAAAVLSATGPASARTAGLANPVAGALGFNVFVAEDASLLADSFEGPLAVGEDVTLAGDVFTVAVGTPGTFRVGADALPSAVVVGGEIDFADSSGSGVLTVPTQGYAKVGDLGDATVHDTDGTGAPANTRIVAEGAAYESAPRVELSVRQPAASVGPAAPIDFAAAFTQLRATSDALAACGGSVVLTDATGLPLPEYLPPGTHAYLSLTPGVTNVLNLDPGRLANITTLTFQRIPTLPQADAPLLINVVLPAAGTAYSWIVPELDGVGTAQAPYILWNFPNAVAVAQDTGSHTMVGTFLGPRANFIDFSPAANVGQIVSRQLVYGVDQAGDQDAGEVHYAPFDAELSCAGGPGTPGPSASPSATPQPSGSPSPSPYGAPRPPRP